MEKREKYEVRELVKSIDLQIQHTHTQFCWKLTIKYLNIIVFEETQTQGKQNRESKNKIHSIGYRALTMITQYKIEMKETGRMVIILSFRPNNTLSLSAQSVCFIFMYTFNRINFQRIQLNCEYTPAVLDDSVHSSNVCVQCTRKYNLVECCRIPFGMCMWSCAIGLSSATTTHISTQLHNFCPEFLSFFWLVLSRFVFSKNLFRMKMNYTHTYNLCALYHFIFYNSVLQIFKTNIPR